jgi:hypothetical protein
VLPPKIAKIYSSVAPWLWRIGGSNRRTAALRASALAVVLLVAAGALLIGNTSGVGTPKHGFLRVPAGGTLVEKTPSGAPADRVVQTTSGVGTVAATPAEATPAAPTAPHAEPAPKVAAAPAPPPATPAAVVPPRPTPAPKVAAAPSPQPAPAPAAPAAEKVVGYAFAKASPLTVFDTPTLANGRKQDFEFGTAYEVIEDASEYVKLRKAGQREAVYVRRAHVSPVPPRWITATDAFNRSERPRFQFWESESKLNDFLAGNTERSKWDYEEYFDSAPKFPLKLPVLRTEAIDILGRDNQRKLVEVMLPVSREMYENFEKAKLAAETPLDFYFILDVSGSTKEFLEKAVAAIAKGLARNEALRKRVGNVVVTTFGATKTSKASLLGPISLDKLERATTWHPQGVDQTTDGDREPLIEALVAMTGGTKRDSGAMGVLVILSGADVDLSGYVAGKSLAIENVDLKLPSPAVAVLGQVTPEPGDDLRNAARRLKDVSPSRYVEFSDTVGEDVIGELVRAIEARKDAALSPHAFVSVAKTAHQKQMMAFLPRVLTANSNLPYRQSYAAAADWYTVPLWLTIVPDLWKETSQ